MSNRKWLYIAAIALLVASSAPAQKIFAGDSGLTTPGGGRTQVDLSGFPIEQVFGARLEGNPVVSLKGESLGSGALDGIDTIVRRPSDVNVSSGQGTGSLAIVALRLVGEAPVSIGGKSYGLHVYLSEFRDGVKAGSITFRMLNPDGGTFNSAFDVRPKLVFTGENGDTTIDCGAVVCGDGSDLKMTATAASFTISGVPGGMDPKAKGIKLLPAGVPVDGDGDGVPELTTLASSNLFIGVIPSRPTFPVGPTDKYKQSGGGSHSVAVPIPSAQSAASVKSGTRLNGTYTPSNPNNQ
jgi:hypothetical protein